MCIVKRETIRNINKCLGYLVTFSDEEIKEFRVKESLDKSLRTLKAIK